MVRGQGGDFGATAINRLAADYRTSGLALIPGVLPVDVCATIVERIMSLTKGALSRQIDRPANYGARGMLRHGLIDGVVVRDRLLEIQTMYHALRPLVAAIAGQSVVGGLYPLSDINVVIYEHNSVKGAHFDTVPITMVLFLTSHPRECGQGALRYETLTGRTAEHYPGAGDLCVFQGRRVRHWVEPLTDPVLRVVVNANYYTVDDHDRDPAIDELLYSPPGSNVS
jgi:hypothetical protein